ncbi:MAG: hypothetical protein M3285_03175 [Actinomycetota bacterium]|nr:hypothetical protein [Actinomycetota bacterium]
MDSRSQFSYSRRNRWPINEIIGLIKPSRNRFPEFLDAVGEWRLAGLEEGRLNRHALGPFPPTG